MKSLLLCLLVTAGATYAAAQQLYVKTFGSPKAKPIIYLHGGPGYNAASFEGTTAQRLADSGFFVIVYDRRGEGRSADDKAQFTFQQTFDDINAIYKQYSLKKASLLGHSFGGMVSVLYANRYPEQVNTVYLVGAPVSLQESFRNILDRLDGIFLQKNDSMRMGAVKQLRGMDTSTMMYASQCFMFAMQNGFYSPKNPGTERAAINGAFSKDSLSKLAGKMTMPAPMGFWKNEHYTTVDLSGSIAALREKKVPVYGIYGKDDGLYSPQQIQKLAALIGEDRLRYIDDASHSVFIDQQTAFVSALTSSER